MCTNYFCCFVFKIHHSATYAIMLPFSVLNYDSEQTDKLYEACIQRLTPHISKSVI